jgi:vancomycin resistance protein YoaR
MTKDSVEPFKAKEQTKASARPAPARSSARAASGEMQAQSSHDGAASSKPQRRSAPHLPRLRAASVQAIATDYRLAGFAMAFLAGTAAALFLFSVVALGYARSYDGRILPGVHVGSTDLSGLTRDQVIAKLQGSFTYLGQGEVTITTPVGVTTITYQQLGRRPDVEAMADAAMAVGHSGNPLADAASVLHTSAFGQDIPTVVQVDPTVIAQRIRQLVGTSSIPAQDAQATSKDGQFAVTQSVRGHGVDEQAIGSEIIERLTEVSAPADLQVGGTFVDLAPRVSDQDAQAAIALAQLMEADVTLTWTSLPSTTAVPSSWTPQRWPITGKQIKSWIVFGMRQDGHYGPALDPAQVQGYLAGLGSTVAIPPVEPSVQWDPTNSRPVGLTAGKDGVGIDLTATTAALSAYVDKIVSGERPEPTLEVVTGPIHPQISDIEKIAGFEIIGKWTVGFIPGPSNGKGANIRVPAKNLNGQVVGPGNQFSFLQAVGPIDEAHGFAKGGVIVQGKSEHTGAMGGGICSASTTMFNAAFTAGLQLDERHAHFYYIDRYPVGRDATVYSNGTTTWDVKWTNDTPYPIIIHSWATYNYRNSVITVELWSIKTNRHVTWTGGYREAPSRSTILPPKYVNNPSLAAGATEWVEYPVDGFKTSVTRVVTDATGAVIHTNTWESVYKAMNGQVTIGGGVPTPTPSGGSPTPPPATPTHPPATPTPPPPTPVVTPSPRRRKVG